MTQFRQIAYSYVSILFEIIKMSLKYEIVVSNSIHIVKLILEYKKGSLSLNSDPLMRNAI